MICNKPSVLSKFFTLLRTAELSFIMMNPLKQQFSLDKKDLVEVKSTNFYETIFIILLKSSFYLQC